MKMTLYVAMGVKKPEYTKRYCIKMAGHTPESIRKRFNEKYPTMGVQVENIDSFVRWFAKHVSPTTVSEMIVDEMVKETKRGDNWFFKYPSHTSTDVPLTKDKLSKWEISSAESAICKRAKDANLGVKHRSLLKRAIGRNLSSSKFLVIHVLR